MIKLKRVYDPPEKTDGIRIFIERLWPRGIKKTHLQVDDWNKEVAPSTELRKWFSHDPAKWEQFQKKYSAELDANPASWSPILDAIARGTVTLIYSSHDEEHNSAVCLKNYLEKKIRGMRYE
ncbi:MAG: DUF488 domain-containing protein [Parachlamydiaceae bacterium]